jgi:hypothetical protein
VRPYANVIVGGESFGVRELRDTTQELTAPAAAMRGDVPARDYQPRLPDGPMPVRVTVDLEWQRSLHLLPRMPLTPIELTGELKVFPGHESTVLVRYDQALEPTMRNAVRVLGLRRGYLPGSITGVIVECKAPPVGIAFGVFIQMNGTWTSCGVITCPPIETRQFNLTMSGGAGITNDRAVRVMFFPAPAAAAGSTDSFEVWNGVIEKTTAGRTSDGAPTPRRRTGIVTTRPRAAAAR